MKRALTLVFIMTFMLTAKDYTKNPKTVSLMNELVQKYDFKRDELEKLFSNVSVQNSALRAFRPRVKKKRTPEQIAALKKRYPKNGAWDRYSKSKISDSRVQKGVDFIRRHRKTFEKVEKKYGVPKEYIAAIIGVESAYGKNVGKYPVFDTLSTLAFEKNRRNTFFQKELMKFMHLSQTEKFNPKNVYGSYAGAIGLGQFMPSNYEAYGVDFNGDGRITLQRPEDAIASVANYLRQNGWRKGEPVATRVGYEGMRFKAYETGYRKTYDRAKLKGISPKKKWDYHDKVRLIKLNREKYDELWYGAKNFFVITRYNHSAYYAMSVHQLATKIAAKMKEE
ncbi:MAG: lytic murein transglycosylase B [Sulfurovum sp.]|uniref:lytic murein transglycosylase B n=1 Tax=Sulfurovum sp. TaxID=1969726 RepID=UPI003C71C436